MLLRRCCKIVTPQVKSVKDKATLPWDDKSVIPWCSCLKAELSTTAP